MEWFGSPHPQGYALILGLKKPVVPLGGGGRGGQRKNPGENRALQAACHHLCRKFPAASGPEGWTRVFHPGELIKGLGPDN